MTPEEDDYVSVSPKIAASFKVVEIGEWERLKTQLAEARAALLHPQWDIVARAMDRYSAYEISDLVALGLIGSGFFKLKECRDAALAALPKETK